MGEPGRDSSRAQNGSLPPDGAISPGGSVPPGGAAAEAGAPVVSIIIVHYRTPEFLARCLETIAQARVAPDHEIIIIDNAPRDDEARRLAEQFQARYFHNSRNVGYARGANQGMQEARGRYYLILNPDIELKPGAVEALVGFMDAHPEAGLCGPKLFSPDGSLQYSARTTYTLRIILLRRTPLGRLWPDAAALRRHLMMDWDHNDVRDVDWMLGGAVMARREAVADVGPMDSRYFLYFEDVDWCERMRGRGWRVVYVPAAEMIHAHRRMSAKGFLGRNQRMHIESALRFYEKWSTVLYLWKQHVTEIRAVATLVLDVVLLSAAFFGAYLTRYLLGTVIPGWTQAKPVLALEVYSRFVGFADVVAIAMFYFLGLYRGEVWRDRWREFFQLVKGIAITSLVVMAATFLFTRRPLSRFTIVLFFPYALLLVTLGRGMLRRLVVGVRERKIYLRRLAIFGPLGRIEETKLRFARHGTFGYEPIFLSHEDERLYPRPAQGDPVERRIRLLERERIAEVVVFESLEDGELLRRLVPRLLRTGLRVRYVSVGESQIRGGRRLDDFMGFTAVVMGGRPRAIGGWLKRITDLGLSALLLLVGLPLHLLQLLAVRRPVVVRRPLVGRRGGFFEMRSYRRLAGLLRYVPGLRYYPALLNVLSGQMSFVGLAPLSPDQWSLAEEGYQWNPPDAPAGILGPVRGVLDDDDDDDDEPVERICARNKEYVERWTPSGDLRIVLEVILERIGGKGRKA